MTHPYLTDWRESHLNELLGRMAVVFAKFNAEAA